MTCGLHRIQSSVFSPPPPFNATLYFTLRNGAPYASPPPEDEIELGERIHALYVFMSQDALILSWAVYEIDQCTAIAHLYDSGFHLDDITTPFPRPLEDYHVVSTWNRIL